MRIQILWFEDLWSNLPDASGQPAFECACTIARFTGEILACLQRLLNEHGVVGYKTKWHAHEFPLEKMERLRTLIQLSKQASTMA